MLFELPVQKQPESIRRRAARSTRRHQRVVNRRRELVTAPAQGLYLVDVAYPAVYQLPPTPYGPLLLAGSCAAPAD